MNKLEVLKNSAIIENKIRYMLIEQNYVEVRTPIMYSYPDIAPIEQFYSYFPTQKEKLYMRIAPTECLKRLIFEGMDSIFEFSVNFRPDEIDASHLPEFVSLEIMKKMRVFMT